MIIQRQLQPTKIEITKGQTLQEPTKRKHPNSEPDKHPNRTSKIKPQTSADKTANMGRCQNETPKQTNKKPTYRKPPISPNAKKLNPPQTHQQQQTHTKQGQNISPAVSTDQQSTATTTQKTK